GSQRWPPAFRFGGLHGSMRSAICMMPESVLRWLTLLSPRIEGSCVKCPLCIYPDLGYNTLRGQFVDLESSTALTPGGAGDVDCAFDFGRSGERLGPAFLDSNHGVRSCNVRLVHLGLPHRIQPLLRVTTKCRI